MSGLEGLHAAGIADEVQSATKPRLARQMIIAALEAGITASWVTGDEAYGQDPQLTPALRMAGSGSQTRSGGRPPWLWPRLMLPLVG